MPKVHLVHDFYDLAVLLAGPRNPGHALVIELSQTKPQGRVAEIEDVGKNLHAWRGCRRFQDSAEGVPQGGRGEAPFRQDIEKQGIAIHQYEVKRSKLLP